MAAIITDDFRRNQARLLVNDIKASASGDFDSPSANSDEDTWPYRGNNAYGVGIGKTDSWQNDSSARAEDDVNFEVPAPNSHVYENKDVLSNLFSIKEIEQANVEQLIAKNTWTNGRKYKMYDQADDDMFYSTGDLYPCCVVYNDNIYLCISNKAPDSSSSSVATSTSAPSHSNNFEWFDNSDGYVWAHVQSVPTANKLITNQFVPVLKPSETSVTTPTNKTDGLLTSISVTSQGTSYASGTTTVDVTLVDIDGTKIDTSDFQFKPVISAGAITRIDILEATSPTITAGDGYYWNNNVLEDVASGTVKIVDTASGSGAEAIVNIAPGTGFAANAIDVLPTWFVGVNASFINEEGGDAPLLKFRQISLIKNFDRSVSGKFDSPDSPLTPTTYDALKWITLSGEDAANLASLNPGDILKQTSSGVTSYFYFDKYESDTIFYHQNTNEEVNFLSPIVGSDDILVHSSSTLSEDDVISTGVSTIGVGEYSSLDSPNTTKSINGEVIFHENRVPFTRSSDQTEEIKLIIQL